MNSTDISLLQIDHPGANDQVYRARRNEIALAAQQYELIGKIREISYLEQENKTWEIIVKKLDSLHSQYACQKFLDCKQKLELSKNIIPSFTSVNSLLINFELIPTAGLIEGSHFLKKLAERKMYCTQYIRHHSNPEYTPEPDIVHELIGHAYMFTDPEMVDITILFGKIALRATPEDLLLLGSIYWFTIEFGLVRENGELKCYGAGLLSSIKEMENVIEGKGVNILDFDIDAIERTGYDYSDIQNTYFVIPSFNYLYEVIKTKFNHYL
jgi:phenylalanine-4-hydroxylase